MTVAITEDDFEIVKELKWSPKNNLGQPTMGGFTLLADEIIEQGRWHVLYKFVFSAPDGKLYAYYARVGSTEMQEDEDPSLADVFEVKATTKTVTFYTKV